MAPTLQMSNKASNDPPGLVSGGAGCATPRDLGHRRTPTRWLQGPWLSLTCCRCSHRSR